MRIAVDIRHLTQPFPSGIGLYTIEVLERMAKLAPEVTFIAFASGRERTRRHLPIFSSPNIKLIHYPQPNRLVHLRVLKGEKLESFIPEAVDAWWFPNLTIINTNLPYAITAHDASVHLFPEFFTMKDLFWNALIHPKTVYKEASAILAVSQRTKRDIVQLYELFESKIRVTHLAADNRFSPQHSPSDKNILKRYGIQQPYFLTLSTLEPRKNIESVLEAYLAWMKQNPSGPNLVITGQLGWKYESIFELKERADATGKVLFTDYIDQRHKPVIVRSAQALLFPSFYEGFGLPVVEAMKSGTPVLTSFTGSLPEVAGDAALYVDPWNVSDIEQAFDILTTSSVTDQLTQSGLKQSKKFDWEITAKRTLTALKALIR